MAAEGQVNWMSLRPRRLVEILSSKPHLSTTLLHLMERHHLQPSAVRRVAYTYPRVFVLEGEVVKLRPQVTVCSAFSTPSGCDLADQCHSLHYLHDVCNVDTCFRSHDWGDQPNTRVLYSLFLEEVSSEVLCRLVQLVLQDSGTDDGVNDGRDSASLWTMNSDGDVKVPEICYDSVEGLCDREATGCQRLHATRHYQFQVRETDGRWQNLQDAQVNVLERAMCDPSQESVCVPTLGPVTCHHYLHQLLGHNTWVAHFKTMTLTNSSEKTLWLRRLCTEQKEDTAVTASTFIWYFWADDVWVPYGTAHSDVKSSLTSDEIETNYTNGDKVMYFATNRSTYTINFDAMTQTNDSNGHQREIRRRPQPHPDDYTETASSSSSTSDDDESSASSSPNDKDEEPSVPRSPTFSDHQHSEPIAKFPVTWDEMNPRESVRVMALNPFTSEYREVVALLEPGLTTRSVQSIKRVQNPQLWLHFQRRLQEMPATNNGPEPMVRQLFHGTMKDVLPRICRKNLDKTLQGGSYGKRTRYGQGTYFFSDVIRAFSYSIPDAADDRSYLVVALVAVGATARGDSTMAAPPTDPDTGVVCDTTVDDVDCPSVYVKYHKEEYYPQYVVTVT